MATRGRWKRFSTPALCVIIPKIGVSRLASLLPPRPHSPSQARSNPAEPGRAFHPAPRRLRRRRARQLHEDETRFRRSRARPLRGYIPLYKEARREGWGGPSASANSLADDLTFRQFLAPSASARPRHPNPCYNQIEPATLWRGRRKLSEASSHAANHPRHAKAGHRHLLR